MNHIMLALVRTDSAESQFWRIDMKIKILISSKAKGLFDVIAIFGTDLEVGKSSFFKFGSDFIWTDLSGLL